MSATEEQVCHICGQSHGSAGILCPYGPPFKEEEPFMKFTPHVRPPHGPAGYGIPITEPYEKQGLPHNPILDRLDRIIKLLEEK